MIRLLLCVLTFVTYYSCGEPNTEKPKPVMEKEQEITTELPRYDLQFLMGKFDPSDHPDFVNIDAKYADRGDRYMHREAYISFIKMYDAAQREGIQLQIKSAARNFDYQKGIWERKWSGQTKISDGTNIRTLPTSVKKAMKILEYSSMPGTSRHHWGTDIDLNSFNNEWFENGEGLKLYNWMLSNAQLYGYGQPYTAKGEARPVGYNEEKWHWSYLPVSKNLTQLAEDQFDNHMIKGFDGAETATDLDVKSNYILGINQKCKN